MILVLLRKTHNTMSANFTFKRGTSPIVSTAIHDGHAIRNELKDLFNLTEAERLREEDPFTSKWLNASDNQIIFHQSRFETDVNRSREKAVYVKPEDAWGLNVWKEELSEETIAGSLKIYDEFYRRCKSYFDELFSHNRKIIVYDIHTYNFRREGIDIEADPEENPEINLGTKNMARSLWDPVIETITDHFSNFDFDNRKLDTRENVKFTGGYFGQWLYEQYGENICPISIEFKKFFMDEHTGHGYDKEIQLINTLLKSSKQPVLNALKKVNS
jgi:N-formylglutamate deformylase